MKTRASPSTPPVNVRIEGFLFAALRERARTEGVSTSSLIDRVLRAEINGEAVLKPLPGLPADSPFNAPHAYEKAGNTPAAGMVAATIGGWPCRVCGDLKDNPVHTA